MNRIKLDIDPSQNFNTCAVEELILLFPRVPKAVVIGSAPKLFV